MGCTMMLAPCWQEIIPLPTIRHEETYCNLQEIYKTRSVCSKSPCPVFPHDGLLTSKNRSLLSFVDFYMTEKALKVQVFRLHTSDYSSEVRSVISQLLKNPKAT